MSADHGHHKVTRIDLIRHGEPGGGDVFRGHVNPPLTELGHWQFHERLRRHASDWDHIISSPLQRCAEAADQLSEELNLPLTIADEWMEIHFGEWEGRPVKEVLAENELQVTQLWADPFAFCAPGGEAFTDFQQRLLNAWNTLLEQHAGKHILLVCHGGVIRALTQHLMSLSPEAMSRLSVPYAALLRFKVDQLEYNEEYAPWVTLEMMDGSVLDRGKLHSPSDIANYTERQQPAHEQQERQLQEQQEQQQQ
ncbi:MAG: histidine phosphatase family protein [Oceanospirillaceae bacterium]|uniref:histidine phosphatase family protein n=1 Tax=unclassified Thalassolituus TaxID=2624967 RepID=UPI000C68E1FC|nr:MULTISPECIES: histidine phosphatase family protein [unclassified Thalassolituus]MBS54108.1 histidine phosphatase family protein [Oceanospirillaceae bacterium]|tara:strand:- start:1312 stop:2067 length:756 start_codon:yes stop_codon:yes gene_type:complete